MKKIKYLFYALRPKQWIKNFFIFLPLIFGKKLFVYPANAKSVIAFFLFSIAAGVVYIVNDIVDFDKDKLHPTKRLRPIASGKLNIMEAWLGALLIGTVAIILSFLLNRLFGLVAVAYLAFNYLYSKILKDAVIVDVFSIGLFFLFRIMAGSIVSDVQMSHWIIFMTVLLALFLGFNKRRQELYILKEGAPHHRRVLTQYSAYFIDQMISTITASIVVVYMLYAVDSATVNRFGTNHLIYSIPFVYYGIFRYLYLIHKVKKEGDPTRILFFDKKIQLNLAIWLLVCISVIYFRL